VAKYGQIPVEDGSSAEERLYLVAFLAMEEDNLLDTGGSALLVCLDHVGAWGLFQKLLIFSVALRIEVVSDGEGFFHGSHS